MSKNINHIQHIKSNVVVDNMPKLPTAQQLVDGEIAINYAKDVETMSIRNASGEIVTFSADNYYAKKYLGSGITENNTVTDLVNQNYGALTAAINDLDENKADVSALTELRESIMSTIESDFPTKDDVEEMVGDKLGDAFTGENSGVTVTEYIQDNELVISAALNDLNDRKMDKSGMTEYATQEWVDSQGFLTDSDAVTEDEITSILGSGFTSGNTVTDAIEDARGDVLNKIDEKLGELFTGDNSGNTVTDVIYDNELVTSAALNDLNSRKMDESAFTEAISSYYTKSEADAKMADVVTDIDNVLSGYTTNEKLYEVLGSGFTGENSGTTVTEYIDGVELVTSAALNDLNSRKLDASAYTPTDLSGYYTKGEVDGMIGEVSSSSTDYVDSILGSGFTSENNVTKVMLDNELVVSAALNDLNSRKLDASAYTESMGDYYTTAQTDSKISDALLSSSYIDSAEYTSSSHSITFKHGETVVSTIDATDFIKDGMVNDVNVDDVESGASTVKCLVISFNTDAGKQDINIPISDFAPILDTTVSQASQNGVTSEGIYNAISAATIVDVALDSTSTRPVQNKAVYDAFISATTYDDEFSSSASSASTNAVQASALTAYLDEKELVIAAALTDLDSRLQGVAYSADVNTEINNISSAAQNMILELSGVVSGMQDELLIDTQFNEDLSSGSTHLVQAGALFDYINEIDLGTASALNDLNSRLLSVVSDITSINERLTSIESRLTALENANQG